jgi:hypothetical protein
MEVGYIADGTHTGYAQQNWSPGTPTPSFWAGLKMKANQLLRPRRSGARNADIWNRTQSRKRTPKDNELRDSFPGYCWPKNAEDRGVQLETVCILNKPDFLEAPEKNIDALTPMFASLPARCRRYCGFCCEVT